MTTQTEFDVRPYLDGMAGGLAGVANVIMQLANPAVGHGVYESPVESGSAMKHPFKRGRTTATYLAVALLGNEDDKRAMRKAICRGVSLLRSDSRRSRICGSTVSEAIARFE